MQIYNTKTRKKEEFKPLHEREVKVYHCGPTVYNYAHIWNLKTYVWNDMIVRVLRFLGYNVKTLMNITDIDDKTIRDSQKSWEDLKSFTEKYTSYFLSDIKKLKIIPADIIAPISNVIPEMIRMINTLLRRGLAYLSEDWSIYYNIKKFKKYWKLAHLDMSWMKESIRINNDEYDKENASDFALWKAYSKEDWDNFWEWEFELPEGKWIVKIKWRPGWHIECSACNMKYHGTQIDIHTGWIDNLFPHHQNEVAQTEGCTRKEFSKYWMHHGHLTVNGKKMSKSLWNFYTLIDLEEKFSPHPNPLPKGEGINTVSRSVLYRWIRLNLINWKYTSSIDLSFSKLESMFSTINNIDETIKLVDREITIWKENISWISRDFREYMQDTIQEYTQYLEDDFNIPEALVVVFSFIKFVNIWVRDKTFSLSELRSIMDMFKTFEEVLWIFDFSILEDNNEIPDNILSKFEERNKAKKEKDFEKADKIRDELLSEWYRIIDDRNGSRVEKN